MAQKFVLTAQLELQSPKNVAQIVRHVKSQLKGMDVALNVKTNPRQMAQTSKQLSQVSKEADKASASTQRLGKTLGAAARRFTAFSIATGTFLALARAVQRGTQEAIDFERELIRISQVTGKSVSQLRGLTQEVTRLASSLGASSSELLNASRTLSQAGFSAERAQKALKILAQTDLAATFNNISDTTEGAIALLRQFRKEANAAGGEIKFLEQSLDAINAVSKKFAVESGDLITVIRRTGGVFEAAGGKLNELIALFTSVRATTRESAETIAVGFRTIFTRIQRSETIDQLKELGIVLQDAKGQFVGPLEAINRLARGLSSLDPRDYRFNEIVESLGGFRQIGKVIPLIKQFSTAQEALNVAQGASGSTARDALTAQKALGVQIKKVREDFSALMRNFVDSSSFRTMTKAILGLAGGFIKMADTLKPLMPMLLSLAALKIGRGLAPALSGFTGMKKFARGGLVPGSGSGDTVPAMLTPGEFVIKKSSVRKMGAGQLRMMNENRHNRGGIQLTAAELGKTAGMKKRALTPSGSVQSRSMQIGGAFLRDTKDSPIQRRLTTKLTPSDFKGQGGKGPSMKGFQEGRTQKLEGILGGGSLTLEIMSGKIPSKVAKNFEGQLRKVVAGPAKRIISNYTGTGFSKQGFEDALNLANFEQVSGNLFEAAIAGSNPPFDNTRTKANAPFDYPSGLGNIGRKLGIPGGIPTDAKRTFGSDALASLVKKARTIVVEKIDRFGRKRALKDSAAEGRPRRSLEDVKGIFGGGSFTEASANAEQQGYSVTKKGSKYKIQKIQKKAAGGSISGSDTVPALLTPGEFVVNKASAQRIGYGNLGRMNRQGYAAGGVVAHGRHAYGNGVPSGKAMGIGNMSWAAVDPIKAGMHEIEISLNKLGISGENAVRVLTASQEAMDKGSTAREAWAVGIQEMTKAIAENEKAVQKANKKGGAGDAAVDDLNKFGGGLGTVAAGTAGAAKGGDAKAAQMLADIQQQEILSITAKIKASDKVRTGTAKGISIAEARMRAEAIVTQRYGVLAKDLKSLDKSSKSLEKAQQKAAKWEKRSKAAGAADGQAKVVGGLSSGVGGSLQQFSFMGTAAALTAVQFMNLSEASGKAATQTVALMGALANGVGTVMQIMGPLASSFGGMIARVTAHMAAKSVETAATLGSAAAEGLETTASGASAAMEGVEAGASGVAASADMTQAAASTTAAVGLAALSAPLFVIIGLFAVLAVGVTAVVGYFAFLAFKSKALAESQSKQNDEMLKALGEGKGSVEDFVNGLETEAKHNAQAAKNTRSAVRAGAAGIVGGAALAGAAIGSFVPVIGTAVGAAVGGLTAWAAVALGGEEAVNKWLGASKAETQVRNTQLNQLKSSAQALGELSQQAYKTRTAFEDIAKDETLTPQQRAEKIKAVAGEGRSSQFRATKAAQDRLANMVKPVVGPLGDEAKKRLVATGGIAGGKMTKTQENQLDIDLATTAAGLKHFEAVTRETAKSVSAIAGVEFKEKTFDQLMKEGGAFAAALKASQQAIMDEARVKVGQTSDVGKQRQIMLSANKARRKQIALLQKQSAAAAVLKKRTMALSLMFAKQRQSMHRALMVIDHFDKFGRAMATLERTFSNLSAVVEGTAMDFKAIPVKGLEDLNKVGNIKQFDKDIDKITAGMGPAAGKIGAEVKKTAEVLRKGRGIIGEKRGISGKSGQVVEAGKILKDLGISEADVGPELFGVLKTGLMDALSTGGMIDPDEFDEIFAPLVKASKNNVEALKKLESIQNGFLEKYSRAINDLLEMMGRENEARAGMVDVRRRGAERMAEARGGSLTPAAAEGFRIRRAQESLRGVRDSRTGGQLKAGDVEGASRTLHHSELQRRRLSARIETADIHQKKKLIQQDALLKNQVARTRAELERLADQSDRASDVMGEIAKQRAGREAQMGTLERFVVGGKEERQEMAKSFMGLQRALSTGTLQSMPAEFRKLTVGLLNEFKDVQIPGTGGLTGQQVKQQLVLSDAVKMGLVSPQMAQGLATGMPEEQRLLHELGSINQEELRAQEAIKESASETVRWAAAIAANTDAMYRHLVKSMGGAAGAAPRVGANVLRTGGASTVGGFASGGQVVYRADGGSIFQPRGTDTVPAMLTPGEFVIRKSAVDRVGTGALHSINSGAAGTVYRARGGPVPGAGRDFTGVEGAVNIKGGGAARTMMAQMLRGMSTRKFRNYALNAGFTKSMVQQTMKVISDGNYDFTNNVAAKAVADTANWLGQWKHLFSVADSRRVGFHKDAGDGVGKLINGLSSHSMFSREVGGSAKYRKASFKLAGLVAPQYLSQIKSIREAAGVFFAKKDVIRRRQEGKYVSDSLWSAAGLNRVRGIDQVKGQGDRAAKRAAQGMGGGWKRVPVRDRSGKVVRKKGKIQYRVVPSFGQSTQQLFGVDQEDMGFDWGDKREKRRPAAAFARGGNVDSVPAMLTPGEFVMSRGAVQKHGVGFMNQLNQGRVQGFNKGGVVYAENGGQVVSQKDREEKYHKSQMQWKGPGAGNLSLGPIANSPLGKEYKEVLKYWDLLPDWQGAHPSQGLYKMYWLQRQSVLKKGEKAAKSWQKGNRPVDPSPVAIEGKAAGKFNPMPDSFLPFTTESERLETWYGSTKAHRAKYNKNSDFLAGVNPELAFVDKLLAEARKKEGDVELKKLKEWFEAQDFSAALGGSEEEGPIKEKIDQAKAIAQGKQLEQQKELDSINKSAKIWIKYIRNVPHTPDDIGSMKGTVPGAGNLSYGSYLTSGSRKRTSMVAEGKALPFSPEEMLNQQGLVKLGELYNAIENSRTVDWALAGTPVIPETEHKNWLKAMDAARESSRKKRIQIIENKNAVLGEQARKRGFQQKNSSLSIPSSRSVGGVQDEDVAKMSPQERTLAKEERAQEAEARRQERQKEQQKAQSVGERIESLRRRQVTSGRRGARTFAQGGPVYLQSGGMFQPRGTDTVPAMLTPGEFVIRKSAVDQIGVGNLTALNNAPGTVYRQQGGIAPELDIHLGSKMGPHRPDYMIGQDADDWHSGYKRFTKLKQEKELFKDAEIKKKREREEEWRDLWGDVLPLGLGPKDPDPLPPGMRNFRGTGMANGGMVSYLQPGGDVMEKTRKIEEERWFSFQQQMADAQRSGKFSKFHRFEGSTDATQKRILAYEKKKKEAETLERFGPNPAMKALQWATTNKKTGKLRQGMRPFQMLGGLGTMYSQTVRAVAAGFHDPEEAARRWQSANQGMMETLTFGQASRGDHFGFQGGRTTQQQDEDYQDRLTDPQGLGRKDPIREASKWLDFGLGMAAEGAADFGTMKLWRSFKQARATTTAAGAASKTTSAASKAASFTPEQQAFAKKMEEFIKANPSVVGAHPSTLPPELAEMLRYHNLARQGRTAEYAMDPAIAKKLQGTLKEIPMQQALPAPAKTSAFQMAEELGSGATKTDMRDIMRAMMGGELPIDTRIKQLTARHKAATTSAEKAAIQKEMAKLRSAQTQADKVMAQHPDITGATAMGDRWKKVKTVGDAQEEIKIIDRQIEKINKGKMSPIADDNTAGLLNRKKELEESLRKRAIGVKDHQAEQVYNDQVERETSKIRAEDKTNAKAEVNELTKKRGLTKKQAEELTKARGTMQERSPAQARQAAKERMGQSATSAVPEETSEFLEWLNRRDEAHWAGRANVAQWQDEGVRKNFAQMFPGKDNAVAEFKINTPQQPRTPSRQPQPPPLPYAHHQSSSAQAPFKFQEFDPEKTTGIYQDRHRNKQGIIPSDQARSGAPATDIFKSPAHTDIGATADFIFQKSQVDKFYEKYPGWERQKSDMLQQIPLDVGDLGPSPFGPKSVGAAQQRPFTRTELEELRKIDPARWEDLRQEWYKSRVHGLEMLDEKRLEKKWLNEGKAQGFIGKRSAEGSKTRFRLTDRELHAKAQRKWEKSEPTLDLNATSKKQVAEHDEAVKAWAIRGDEGYTNSAGVSQPFSTLGRTRQLKNQGFLGRGHKDVRERVLAKERLTFTKEQQAAMDAVTPKQDVWKETNRSTLSESGAIQIDYEHRETGATRSFVHWLDGQTTQTRARGGLIYADNGGWVPRTDETKRRMEQWRNLQGRSKPVSSNVTTTKVLPAGGMRDAKPDELKWKGMSSSGPTKRWLNALPADRRKKFEEHMDRQRGRAAGAGDAALLAAPPAVAAPAGGGGGGGGAPAGRVLSTAAKQRKQRLELKAYQRKVMRWRMGLERKPPQPPAGMGAGMWQGQQRGWRGPQNFQHGGNVDSVPAMLTPGEFVMNRQAVQRHGTAFMQSVNKGQIPGFNQGGPVYAANGVNVRNAAGAPSPVGDMAAEFAKVGATLSDDLKGIFGTMEFHHRVTVDGQLNIGGINSEVVANAVRDALASYVVGAVKQGLDAAKKSFRGTE